MRTSLGFVWIAALVSLLMWPGYGTAQTPAEGFRAGFPAACANARPGSELAARCRQIFGDLAADRRLLSASIGNRLNVVPAQGRIAALGGRARTHGLQYDRRDARREEHAISSPTGSSGLSFAGDESGASVEAHSDFDRWTLQASAGIGRLERDDSEAEAGFDNDRQNALLGIGYRVSDRALVGAALTYDREDTDFVNGAGAQQQRALSLIAHGAWWPRDAWAIYASAGFGTVDLDTRREINFNLPFVRPGPGSQERFQATALGDAEGDRLSAALGVERELFAGERNLRLELGIDHERTDFDSLLESGGGGFALALPARSIRSTQSKLGFSGDFVWSTASGVVTPYARAYWRHEFDNDGRLVTIRLREDTAGAPIRFRTPEPDRNFFEAGAGVAWMFAGGRSLYLDVESLLGHAILSGYTISVGGSLEF